jgi:hypothetical protein
LSRRVHAAAYSLQRLRLSQFGSNATSIDCRGPRCLAAEAPHRPDISLSAHLSGCWRIAVGVSLGLLSEESLN